MRKIKGSFILLLFLFQSAFVEAQNENLNKKQMLQDFDQAVNFINTFAVHKDLNSLRLQIDYDKAYEVLRKEINESTTDCEFRDILHRVVGLVQDAHCTFMDSHYLGMYGKYQKKINFPDNQTYKQVALFEEKCSDTHSVNLSLPILYKGGKYFFYADFTYKSKLVKRGVEITQYNNQNITDYIKDNYDKIGVVRWDDRLKNPYKESFYKRGEKSFVLTFNAPDLKYLTFSLNDTVSFVKPQQREIYFGSQSKKQVFYNDEHKLLYIGIPFMDATLGEEIVNDIDSLRSIGKSFNSIVIDIRGNGGGNDMCYRTVIQHLISKDIPFDSELKFKYEKSVLDFYADDQKNIKPETISLLNNKTYWTKKYDINKIEPDTNSIAYQGKIYVLQDPFIFSSASNLSNLCLNSEQLVSVGETNDLVGGRQTEPLFIKLDNSGLVFRLEPMLDFSQVNNLSDFSHNKVEVRIPITIEDYYLRTTYEGDIYSQEFLLTHDRLIKYVISQ